MCVYVCVCVCVCVCVWWDVLQSVSFYVVLGLQLQLKPSTSTLSLQDLDTHTNDDNNDDDDNHCNQDHHQDREGNFDEGGEGRERHLTTRSKSVACRFLSPQVWVQFDDCALSFTDLQQPLLRVCIEVRPLIKRVRGTPPLSPSLL